jgi:hypothetical protein
MSRLAQGLAGPSAGLASSIGQGRNAVAQFAKDTQRQAASQAVKAGAVGQGTQTALGQEVRQSVMSKLGANEENNAQMISNEGKAFMDKALDIGQQNKQLAQNQSQFDVSSGQNQQQINNQASQFQTTAGQNQQQIDNQKSQFATTSGQNQQQIDNQKTQFGETLQLQKDELAAKVGQQNLSILSQLGGDIPVIASKVMNQVLGASGAPLSDAEKGDLGKWYDQQKAKGEKMDAQMDTLITSMIKEATDPKKSAMTQLAEGEAEKQLQAQNLQQKLSTGAQLTPDEIKQGIASGAFPQVAATAVPAGKHVAEFLKKNPNGVINVGGGAYKLVKGSSPRTGSGTFSNQERHTDVAEVVDMATGQTKYFYNGKVNDKMPKTVSNDVTPFGF